ncbi:hypothetical protein [Castellaniella sp. MT123]|uniref:hypothetical protein n=1 Tax=Castellaniella sp. MT123 TaxID=3140381 RepID=UPI0031F3E014
MNTKMIVIASFAALAIGAGAPSVAATDAPAQAGGPGMMQQGQAGSGVPPMMRGGGSWGMMDGQQGGMRSGQWMRGGMMGGGMMNACPAMDGAGLDPKTMMQMRGEMMRAMGDILVKYADKIQPPAAKP